MPFGLFDILNEICEYKSDLDFDDFEIYKAYDIYMINRYLSMIEFLIPIVNYVNRTGIEKKDHYNFLRSMIPKNRYKFSYIKKNVDNDINTNVNYLCNFFEIGNREAKMYIDMLKTKHFNYLKTIYTYGKNGKNIYVTV